MEKKSDMASESSEAPISKATRKRKALPQRLDITDAPVISTRSRNVSRNSNLALPDVENTVLSASRSSIPNHSTRSRRKVRRPDRYIDSYDDDLAGLDHPDGSSHLMDGHPSSGNNSRVSNSAINLHCAQEDLCHDGDPGDPVSGIKQVNSYSRLMSTKSGKEINGSPTKNQCGADLLPQNVIAEGNSESGNLGPAEQMTVEEPAIRQGSGERRKRGRPRKCLQVQRTITEIPVPTTEINRDVDECETSGSRGRGRGRGRGRPPSRKSEPQPSESPDNVTSCEYSDTVLYDNPSKSGGIVRVHMLPKIGRGRPCRRGRGRRKEGAGCATDGEGQLPASAQMPIKCGVCLKEYQSQSQYKKHTFTEHNGLARPFGNSQIFTPEEERLAYYHCVKGGCRLKCRTPECSREFTTAGGYQYHLAICGKEERSYVTCELCGKVLIPASVKPHMKAFHPVTPPPEENEKPEETLPKRRAAAERAQERVAKIALEVKSAEDIKREVIDIDYCTAGDEEDHEMDKNEEVINDEKLYTDPEKVHVSKELFAEWRDELLKKGFVLCKNKGCIKVMNTIKTIRFHYYNCPASTHGGLYKCVICQYCCSGHGKMLKHVDLHKMGTNVDNNGDMNGLVWPSQPKHKSKVKMSLVSSQVYQSIRIGEFDKRLFSPHVEMATQFYHSNYQSTLFCNWPPLKSQWTRLTKSELDVYLPEAKNSVKFQNAFSADSDAEINSSEWEILRLFQASTSNMESKVTTCFTGGPVWACSWCPTLNTSPCQQFIATYSHREMDSAFPFAKSYQGPGLLQIWDVGVLEQGDDTIPKLALGIAHDYGAIWNLSWCASGCWEEQEFLQDGDRLPRLGLLAAACADGYIRIFSVPHPDSLQPAENLPIYKVTPTAVLDLSKDFSITSPESLPELQCTALSWHQGRGHQYIAAGYNNGIIAVFDLNSTSALLRANDAGCEKLYPYIAFSAHGSIVTGLDFSHIHNGRFLASVSRDRWIKFWDLENVSLPYNMSRQKVFTGIKWPPHWCGTYTYGDHSYNIVSNATSYTECGYYGDTSITLASHNSCIWDASTSHWLNCLVSCDVAGEVVIAVVGHLMKSSTFQGTSNHRRLPLYRIETVSNFPENSMLSHIANDNDTTKKGKSVGSTSKKTKVKNADYSYNPINYQEAVETYSLKYTNASVVWKLKGKTTLEKWNLKSMSMAELQHVSASTHMQSSAINEYPLTSVNRVCWNPNLGSHLWIATGEQSGMLRLIRVNCLDKLSVEEVRMALLTGDITGTCGQ